MRPLRNTIALIAGFTLALLFGLSSPAAAVIPEPVPPDPVTRLVSPPYDDLSAFQCEGTTAVYTQISYDNGVHAVFLYALAGDTIELIGEALACELASDPADAIRWAFEANEIAWSIDQPTGAPLPLGTGTVIQSGRDALPTISSLMLTVAGSDNGSRIRFGVPDPVPSLSGVDTVAGTTSLLLTVLDPQLRLVKEVCTADSAAQCDPADDAVWTERAETTSHDVIWRLTATNTGNIDLLDVAVAADELTNGTADGNECLAGAFGDLAIGASASIACVTPNTQASGAGDVINSAKLTSTFEDPSGGEILPRFPNGVESNVDDAAVYFPEPALGLVKQVCSTGVGCDIADDSQWIEHVVVEAGSAAQWRLTVTNTGNLALADVAIARDELSGGLTGPSAECLALGFGDLAPGESASLDCATGSITNTEIDTVNTAVAHGTPIDPEGDPIPGYEDGIDSNEDDASAIAALDPPDPGRQAGPGNTPGAQPPTQPTSLNPAGAPAPAAAPRLAATGATDVQTATAAGLIALAIGAAVVLVARRRARGTR